MMNNNDWISDDITFCLCDCDEIECNRNKKNIRIKTIPHSFANFENADGYCKRVNDKSYILNLLKRDAAEPVFHPVFEGNPYLCPNCNVEFIDADDDIRVMPDYTYCWKCGQKVDWRDAKNERRRND